jgi:hypothetical protein
MDDTAHPIPGERPLTAEEHRLARWIMEHGVPEAEPFLAQRGGRMEGLQVYGLGDEDPPRTLPGPEVLRPFEGVEPVPPGPGPDPERVR